MFYFVIELILIFCLFRFNVHAQSFSINSENIIGSSKSRATKYHLKNFGIKLDKLESNSNQFVNSVQFNDVTYECGVGTRGNNHSVAYGDYDGDGYLDIYIVKGNWEANVLYRNSGDLTFSDVTWLAGVGDSGYGYHAMFGDYDNDSDLDIYVVNSNTPNLLYMNNGDGTFTNVAFKAGVSDSGDGRGAIFIDYDNDGFLDIYVANTYGQANILYKNNHDGTFSDVTEIAGVGNTGDGSAIAPGDFDNDGDMDLYVVNYRNQADVFYQNNGDGTFTDISDQAGIENKGWGMGAAFGDLDGDGLLDIYVTNHYNQSNVLYHNNGDGTFTNIIKFNVGLIEQSSGRGVTLGDFDNDGELDIYVANYEPNSLYQNTNGTFFDIANVAGVADPGNTYGVAFADLDLDGFLDLDVVNWKNRPNALYRNSGNSNHWIVIQTEGQESNHDGIGARIRIVTQGKLQIREITGGCGYLCQDSYAVEFGLANSPVIDTLIVKWPSGIIDTYTDIAVNQYITVIEGISLIPVELFSFKASYDNNSLFLEWRTKTEMNNYGFDVERLINTDWEKIGFVKGKGTTNNPQKYQFVDHLKNFNLNISSIKYRLKQIDIDGAFKYSKVITVNLNKPKSFKLEQNYPNPFNASTTIRYELSDLSHVRIEIFNSRGERTKTLIDHKQDEGVYEVIWDGTDHSNRQTGSGIYICRLSAGQYVNSIKLVMIK